MRLLAFIIYNIFKISVEKDIRLYGQLKTIGTSPRQIRYMVIRQGTVLSLTGIPAGLVLGWLLGNALLPIVMTNFTMSEAEFIIPPVWVWALSGLFTWITVRISCGRPGRIAGRISPVEALKYHGAQNIAKTHQRGMDSSHRIASMAAKNLGRNKGKTVLVVLSISFSAVLLTPEHTLADADALMAKFRISGVPVTEGRRLVGIITNRDLKFETDFTKKIKESMTAEGLITAKAGTTLEEAKKILAKA